MNHAQVLTEFIALITIVAQSSREAVVYKPAGLSSERGPTDRGESLITLVRAQCDWSDGQLPHRLDRPTRGLMMVSADRAQAALHAEEIREGRWTKWYFARIPLESFEGHASALLGEHKAYLKRVGRFARVVRSGGEASRLTVLAVEASTDCAEDAHALIRLDTGRFHQIRAMCAALGFPLVGDEDYGGPQWCDQRAARSVDFAMMDLEAVALRVERESATDIHRLTAHRDRMGVHPALEAALDAAMLVSGPNARRPNSSQDASRRASQDSSQA